MSLTDAAVAFSAGSIDEPTLGKLLAASAAINASLELSATLAAIAQSAADVLEAEASSVLLLDRRRGKLIFKAAVGNSGDVLIGEEFDATLGIAGRVAATGKAMLVPNVQASPDFFAGIDNKSSFRTRDLIAAPLRNRGDVIGVVEVLNKRGGRSFTERDIDLLQYFGNLAAISMANAQTHETVKRENRGLRETSQAEQPMIGGSAALKHVMEMVDRVAPTNSTALLLGATGTGKELTARSIHARSPRRQRPFIAINCAALPETLLESELFGHEAGAFTGATATKLGRFELADGGTLFLDEIGDISLSTQIKLLRVLQEREFVRVGGTKTIACDVRIIAATNRDLKHAMEAGQFREDLYYRLNVFPISLPPLRERREDIPLLIEYFATRTSNEMGRPRPAISPEAVELLCAHDWPGNIREMRNVIERAVLLCDGGTILPQQLPREIAGGMDLPRAGAGESSLDSYEKAMIVKALRENGWNQTRTARALGVPRDNLRYRMRKYRIEKPDEEE